jgi:asparagine synthase (glutamine-hydrolysing)
MCGICGLWRFDGAPVSTQAIAAMSDRLAHRGPDGAGIHLDVALGLGHRRLAILDMSPTGHQPMSYGDGRYWITYNGEVYNFLELRHRAGGEGHRFQSSSDTEVILAAYAQWGAIVCCASTACGRSPSGTPRRSTLFLARDRFGIKPLFYLRSADRFAFASEMEGLSALCPTSPARVDLEHLCHCPVGSLLPGGDRSVPDGGHPPPAARPLHARSHPRDVKMRRWWHTLDHLVTPPEALPAQAAALPGALPGRLPAAHAQRRAHWRLSERRAGLQRHRLHAG